MSDATQGSSKELCDCCESRSDRRCCWDEITSLRGQLEAAEQHVKVLRENFAAHKPGCAISSYLRGADRVTCDCGGTAPEPPAARYAITLADEIDAADVETIMEGSLLSRTVSFLRTGHHEYCDVNDKNIEGIKKPCNCGAVPPPADEREIPMGSTVRHCLWDWSGKVVAIDTKYEIEGDDGSSWSAWHRELEVPAPTKSGEQA